MAYDHYLEEPGNLEVEYFSTFATQRDGNDFHAFWLEFEYGAKAWWTTEVYLDAQSIFRDSTLFTGFRWENRIRPLKHEHGWTFRVSQGSGLTTAATASSCVGVFLENSPASAKW